MAWPTDYSTGADVNAFENLVALWRAVGERNAAATGDKDWPRTNLVYCRSTIGNLEDIGDNTYRLTDSTEHWLITDAHHTDSPRWVAWEVPGSPNIPANYDVVLNCDDVDTTRHIHVHITGNTDTQLAIGTIVDWITAGWIPSTSWLIGKPYVIIKRGGFWWGERRPTPPNDDEIYIGDGSARTLVRVPGAAFGSLEGKTFTAGAIIEPIFANTADTLIISRTTSAPAGAFTVTDGATTLASGTVGSVLDGLALNLNGRAFTVDSGKVNGKDLLTYAGARVKRITLGAQTTPVLEFARQADPLSGPISIVRAGARAWPGRKGSPIAMWYGGATQSHYTHAPGDRIYQYSCAITPMAATSVSYSSGSDPAFCEMVSISAFDVDLWSQLDEMCSEADLCRSPNLFKALRGLQLFIEAICGSFVPVDDYTGKDAIPLFRPATLFEAAGINFVGRYTATADADGHYTFSFPAQPVAPYWALLDPNGDSIDGNVGGADGSLSFTGGAVGKTYTLVVARGWTRYVPREFRYAYPRSAFIPDIQISELDGSKSVVDPPNNDFPGAWIDRDPSTNYKRYEPFGFATDSGAAFATGARARYVGDNWGDPGITPQTPVSEDGPLDTLYYRNLWEGRFRKDLRGGYDAMKRGRVEYAGGKWLRAADVDWWNSPIGNGVMRTETGTATSGSSTTLSDTTKYYVPDDSTTGDPVLIPFWDSATNGPRWAGMMLEVDKSVNDAAGHAQTVTYHTPITGHAGTTITFEAVAAYTIPEVPATDTEPLKPAISVPALAVVAGSVYRIREPAYRRNWWKGRKVTITSPSGSTSVRTITHNDKQTLWLDSAPAFDVTGATFTIDELTIGHVYTWSGSAWQPVTGTTHKGNELLPKNDKTYGRVMAGDYLGGLVYQEMYRALNVLVWTRQNSGWTNKGELNAVGDAFPGVGAGWGQVWSDGSGSSSEAWAYLNGQIPPYWAFHLEDGDLATASPTAKPTMSLVQTSRAGAAEGLTDSGGCSYAGVQRVYAYPTITGVPHVLASAAEIFCRAVIDVSDPDEGHVSDWPSWVQNTFDGGSTSLIFRKYASVGTIAASTDADRVGDTKVGATSEEVPVFAEPPDPLPHVVAIPPALEPGARSRINSGYYITNSVAILKWNIAGGFTYVA